MSDQLEVQDAEKDIDIALRARDARTAMISFYEARPEAGKSAFVTALIDRIVGFTHPES